MKVQHWLILAILTLAMVALAACGPRSVRLPNGYVSYETQETPTSPAVTFGPKEVRRLEMHQDYAIMHFQDGRIEMVPLDEKLLDLKWSKSRE
ncbi:MAG: hypothetical protein ACLFUS_11215 [Candidatus Sumerlaeia bacterium]